VVKTSTVVRVCDKAQPEPLSVRSLRAKVKKSSKLRALWRLYSYETLPERLAQDLQDVAAARRPFIQQAHPMVRQRHFAWPRHLPATDQPSLQNRGEKAVEASAPAAMPAGG
jgi:hypothetical protein